LLEFAALKFGLDKFSGIIWGFPIEELRCKDVKLWYHSSATSPGVSCIPNRWMRCVSVQDIGSRLNVVADGLSRTWEGQPNRVGDGSEWMVSEDWEARTGLVNDVLHITLVDSQADGLREHFKDEPVFKEVIEAIFDMDQGAELRDKRRARHRASQYAIEEDKLWRIRG
ncbi:hypothetical protein P692DRAFT_20684962, partial [Suillus brevipes Sb2]